MASTPARRSSLSRPPSRRRGRLFQISRSAHARREWINQTPTPPALRARERRATTGRPPATIMPIARRRQSARPSDQDSSGSRSGFLPATTVLADGLHLRATNPAGRRPIPRLTRDELRITSVPCGLVVRLHPVLHVPPALSRADAASSCRAHRSPVSQRSRRIELAFVTQHTTSDIRAQPPDGPLRTDASSAAGHQRRVAADYRQTPMLAPLWLISGSSRRALLSSSIRHGRNRHDSTPRIFAARHRFHRANA